MADTILLKGVSHTALPTLLAREPAVAFDPMTGNAQLFIGTPDGNQVLTGTPGPPGAGAVGIVSTAPGTGLTAAKGDGTTDDTAAIQGQISAAQLGFVPVLFSTGLYSLTAPLQVCRPSAYDLSSNTVNSSSGFLLRGLTAPSRQAVVPTGNMLQITTAGQDAVLQIGKGACVGSRIESLALDGGSPALHTLCGIHTLYDYWSGISLVNVRISGVDWSIWIDGALGGGNGEFFNLYNCDLGGRVGCYKNTSLGGQALIHTLTACSGGTGNGGTDFWMKDGQLNVFGWSSTQGAGAAANVFLRLDDALTGRCNFVGGRCENVDTLISWQGGSQGQGGTVGIEGFDFVGMSGTKPFLSGGGTNCNYRFTVKRCNFGMNTPVAGPLILAILTGGNEQITFEDCDWGGWNGGYAQLTGNSHITLIRCRYVDANGAYHAL